MTDKRKRKQGPLNTVNSPQAKRACTRTPPNSCSRVTPANKVRYLKDLSSIQNEIEQKIKTMIRAEEPKDSRAYVYVGQLDRRASTFMRQTVDAVAVTCLAAVSSINKQLSSVVGQIFRQGVSAFGLNSKFISLDDLMLLVSESVIANLQETKTQMEILESELGSSDRIEYNQFEDKYQLYNNRIKALFKLCLRIRAVLDCCNLASIKVNIDIALPLEQIGQGVNAYSHGLGGMRIDHLDNIQTLELNKIMDAVANLISHLVELCPKFKNMKIVSFQEQFKTLINVAISSTKRCTPAVRTRLLEVYRRLPLVQQSSGKLVVSARM